MAAWSLTQARYRLLSADLYVTRLKSYFIIMRYYYYVVVVVANKMAALFLLQSTTVSKLLTDMSHLLTAVTEGFGSCLLLNDAVMIQLFVSVVVIVEPSFCACQC